MKEPYCLPISEIAKLTPYQVNKIYFRPSREEAPPVQKSYEQIFKERLIGLGLTPEQAEQRWQNGPGKSESDE